MTFFRFLLGVDVLIALVIGYFFVEGLGDGGVSSFNAGLWLLILVSLAVILFGGYWLHTHQYAVYAKVLLSVLAIPGLLFGAFFLLILLLNPRWN